MKEMTYCSERIVEILTEGLYRNHLYAILNLGTHPTAYVEERLGLISYDDDILSNVAVHGGFTYLDFPYWKENKEKKYLGWDYGHYCDFSGYENQLPRNMRIGGKRWTTEEIMEEVKSVIDQLITLLEVEE